MKTKGTVKKDIVVISGLCSAAALAAIAGAAAFFFASGRAAAEVFAGDAALEMLRFDIFVLAVSLILSLALFAAVVTVLLRMAKRRDQEYALLKKEHEEERVAFSEARKRLERDPLTGVLGRSSFIKQAESICLSSSPNELHALLMVDIDFFKCVNDTYGHDCGDAVLKRTAEHLKGALRMGDIIGRLGGDEFTVLMADIKNPDAVRQRTDELCSCHCAECGRVSLSIGIAVYPTDGRDFPSLYKKADKALYATKHRGKNGCTLYSPELENESPCIEYDTVLE